MTINVLCSPITNVKNDHKILRKKTKQKQLPLLVTSFLALEDLKQRKGKETCCGGSWRGMGGSCLALSFYPNWYDNKS